MTYKETIKCLNQVRHIKAIISRKEAQIAELRELALKIAGQNYSEAKVQTSKQMDKTGDVISSILDAEQDLQKEIKMWIRTEKHVLQQIDTLESLEERNVLYLKYLEGRTFEYIAEDISKSLSSVHRIHRRGIQKLAKTVTISIGTEREENHIKQNNT